MEKRSGVVFKIDATIIFWKVQIAQEFYQLEEVLTQDCHEKDQIKTSGLTISIGQVP